MTMREGKSEGTLHRVLPWSGVVLMIASVIWWELLPGGLRSGREDERTLGGPVARVVIDAGHGGDDTGAMRPGVVEKDLTLDVARRLDQILRAQGLATTLTRSGDETVSLSHRAAVANEERDCVFVSIHFDDGKRAAASGVQTFYAARQAPQVPKAMAWLPLLQPVSNTSSTHLESQSLAGFVQEALVGRTQAIDRGTKAQQFFVVANVRHPAVLVEGGFLSNDADLARLMQEEYRQELATAIGEGILRYRKVAESNGRKAE